MKVTTVSKVFKLMYPLIVAFDMRVVTDMSVLKEELNNKIASSEFWIDSIERVIYENDVDNALQFNFRLTRVLQVDADEDALRVINNISMEVEKVLLLLLQERGEK